MASSGNKSVNVTSNDTMKFSWTEASQSIDKNTTTVNWTLQLISADYGAINSSITKNWSVTVNGTKYSGTNTVGISANSTKTLASGKTTITHNADGTKTFSFAFSQEFAITYSGNYIGTVSGSGNGTLDTIPRKSTLSVANGTLEKAQTLTVSRSSNSFTHTITYTSGTASGTIVTKSASTSISFTPPLSLASQNKVGTSVPIKYTITTYNGNTSLGSNTYTKTCAIPANVKPSCSVTVSDATGAFTKYGGFIEGVSKFAVTITATQSYGASIKSYTATANGSKYTTASFTTDVLKSFSDTMASSTITATVTDSRGRTGTASVIRSVLGYTAPVISKLTVGRCNEDGTPNEKGELVQATFSAVVSALNDKNTAVYILRYKKTSETTFTAVPLTGLNNVYSAVNKSYIFPADTGSSYDVEIVVKDDFSTTTRTTSASTAFTLMHFGKDGTSVSIGKISEESNMFDVALKARFNSPVFGNVMGLSYLPDVAANTDMNDFLTTGSYAVKSNADAEKVKNIPAPIAGRLEVANSTGKETPVSNWAYLRQKYIPYLTDYPTYERNITRNESNVWSYGEWIPTTLREQKILWSGGRYMTEDHTVELNELVSQQPNGIVLVFSRYANGAAENSNFNSFFVPKKQVEAHAGSGSAFFMTAVNFSYICAKYLYISDDRITGNANNGLTGTTNGVTYANNAYVLRYVIGV